MADDRVKQVKLANDIVEVVGGYLALRQVGQTYKGLCPFHDDHRPSFDVDPRRQRYRCWACGKFGDVISFVQEFEHVPFREALESLAKRAGIALDDRGGSPHAETRAQLLDVMRWATQRFHECLLDAPQAEEARRYLGERGLRGETVRKWGLGYAPASGQWLLTQAEENRVSLALLEKVGLIGQRNQGEGHYDRFRDRVLFPIRDIRGQAVGLGGRVLPGSPLAERGPKYYNSCDTPLFTKSEQLYGIDQARAAAEKAGYLAIVEGYTDVLMAHQLGVAQVVATMGTALNERHVRLLRRLVPRVVLVFDADAGGDTGVDRALELFASHDMELSVAALPAGLDPCDLLIQQGAEPFRRVLESATDPLEMKLQQMLARDGAATVEGQRRVVDAVLAVIARASALPGQTRAIKMELMVTRIARRFGLKEETLWRQLDGLRRSYREAAPGRRADEPAAAPAPPEERRLLEVLLTGPEWVEKTAAVVSVEEVAHPGLRRLLEGLYALHEAGLPATLDELRESLQDSPALLNKAFELQDHGLARPNRAVELDDLLARFRERREKAARQQLAGRLSATSDHQTGLELLRRIQGGPTELGPEASPRGGPAERPPLAPSA